MSKKSVKFILVILFVIFALDIFLPDKTDRDINRQNPVVNITQTTAKETSEETSTVHITNVKNEFSLQNIPDYDNDPYVEVNDNIPFFTEKEISSGKTSFIALNELDSLGRCQSAFASVSTDTMPTEKRGNIGSVKPTGWHTVKYAGIDGNYLYNRCHLLMYALTGLNAEPKNLITGTRYLNIEGNLPFEESVVQYIENTGNHVLYRVTPIFNGDNLLCSGELMEAYSVEDNGQFHFCVYCYNVQPGIEIDYATGESSGPEFVGTEK